MGIEKNFHIYYTVLQHGSSTIRFIHPRPAKTGRFGTEYEDIVKVNGYPTREEAEIILRHVSPIRSVIYGDAEPNTHLL